jgi:hypothetical protein
MSAVAESSWTTGPQWSGPPDRLAPTVARRNAAGAQAWFWSDRQAVRLKLFLLAACLLAAALLEVPW